MSERICGKITRASVHKSVVVGGVAVGMCGNKCLPDMVVCREHATPDAVEMLAVKLSKERDKARKEVAALRREMRRLRGALETCATIGETRVANVVRKTLKGDSAAALAALDGKE